MKICWFDDMKFGIVENDQVADVSAALESLPAPIYPAANGDLLMANLDTVLAAAKPLLAGAVRKPVSEVKFHSPSANPSKIIGVPVNYLKHVEEAEADKAAFTDRYAGGVIDQGLFLKANSALVGNSAGLTIRFPDRRTDHEMELGVIIGKIASQVREEDALDYVAGYTIALDFVVRGPEDRSFRKSCDTFAMVGPWMVTADEIDNPDALDISLAVNGEIRQQSNTSSMIIDIRQQISWASKFYTLYPGDVIMTGTCEGVGPVKAGDVLHCEIQNIGSMDVAVNV